MFGEYRILKNVKSYVDLNEPILSPTDLACKLVPGLYKKEALLVHTLSGRTYKNNSNDPSKRIVTRVTPLHPGPFKEILSKYNVYKNKCHTYRNQIRLYFYITSCWSKAVQLTATFLKNKCLKFIVNKNHVKITKISKDFKLHML